MRAGRRHRASAELAYHVLDVVSTIYESAQSGRRLGIASSCERPPPIAPDWPADEQDGDLADRAPAALASPTPAR
jgi:hypothetical protein